MGAIKHLAQYLAGTRNLGIILDATEDFSFTSIHDAGYGNIELDRRSASGCVILINKSPIFFSACKQKIVALSSAEAEYVSLSSNLRTTLWFYNLLSEIKKYTSIPIEIKPRILTDSKPAIAMITSDSNERNKSRHIDIRFHWIKQLFRNEDFALEWVQSKENTADLLTKRHANITLFNTMRDTIMSNVEEVQGSVDENLWS